MTAGVTNPDNLLINRFCEGDDSAFNELMRANRNWVLAAARKSAMLCTRFVDPVSEAEDIASESWIKVYKYVCKQYKNGNFKGWLRVIIRHTAVDACRKAKPGPGGKTLPDPTNHQPSSEFWKLFYRAMKVCLKKLKKQDPKTYDVFFLRMIKNLSTRETAGRVGIPEQEVSNRLNRAKQFLYNCTTAEMSL